MTRRGFTLLEVLVALIVTSVVASLAFGAASAGLDVRARLDRAQRDGASALALRSLLHDALRHAESGSGAADTTFALAGGTLRFATRGVRPPLGTGDRWAVELRAERGGVVLRAAPLDGDGTPIRVVAPAVADIEVRLLESAGGPWIDAWPRPDTPPLAVAVRFLGADGRDVLPALVARTRPEGAS